MTYSAYLPCYNASFQPGGDASNNLDMPILAVDFFPLLTTQ